MGFAAEIKDFLNAWQAGEKINASQTDREYKLTQQDALKQKTLRDNDPETLALADKTARARLGLINAQTGASGASTSLTNERRNALRLQQDLIRKQAAQPAGGSGLLPGGSGGGALPLNNTMTLGDDEPVAEYADGGAVPARYAGRAYPDTDDNMFFADGVDEKVIRAKRKIRDQTGISIYGDNTARARRATQELADDIRGHKSYEDGGLVPEEDDVDEVFPGGSQAEPLTPEGALPIGGGAPTDISSQSRQRGPNLDGIVSPQLVRDATKNGLAWGANAFGLGKVGGIRTNQQKLAAQQFAQGRGGLTDEEMAAAKKAVDPQGKLSEAQRNMAALGSVYQYQMNKGNPEGAQRVAFQMLQHYRVASQRYAAIAAQAANSGDLDLATKAAVKAYANIPDGRDVEIFKDDDGKLNFSYTDATTGKTIAKGLLTPQQLASSAMGLAQGGFDKALLIAAGAAEKAQGGGKGTGALKTSDRKNLGEMAAEPVAKFEEEYKSKIEKDKNLKPLDPGYLDNLRDATQHILSDNPKTTPREAFKAAQALYTLDKTDPKKVNFKIEKDENEEGMNVIKLNSGHKMRLSDDQLEPILLDRAARLKAREAEEDTAKKEKDKPGALSRAGGAISDIATGVGNIAGDAGKAVSAVGDVISGALPLGLKKYAQNSVDRLPSPGALANPNLPPDENYQPPI